MTLPLRCVCAPLLRGREGERERWRDRQRRQRVREKERQRQRQTGSGREKCLIFRMHVSEGKESPQAQQVQHIAVGLFLPSEH